MNPFDDQTLSVAFPGAILGAMPAKGGGQAAHSDPVEQAALDAQQGGGPYGVASTLGFDEVIDPRELRNVLLSGLRLARARTESVTQPVSRVGSLP